MGRTDREEVAMARVLVGFDGSPTSATALAWAVPEARLRGDDLEVVTVVGTDPPELAVHAEDLRDRLGPQIVEATGGEPFEHHVAVGDSSDRLVASCAAGDLLVVGSRARGPVAERLLGSVSRACLHAAPCPVVVVREEPERTHGLVLVGIDGSVASRNALTVAAKEARLRAATLRVIHTVHQEHLGAEWIAPTMQDLLDWGHHLVDKEVAEAGVVDARAEVVHGHPNEVLTSRSRYADLLVVGSRGHNPLSRLLLGSTAEHCARHGHCATMVVRAPAE